MTPALERTRRPLCAALAALLLGWSLASCGGAGAGQGGDSAASSSTAASQGALDGDGDRDTGPQSSAGGGATDGDDGEVSDFGHAASAADRQAIASLVGRYYAAAGAEDGTRACALTYFIVAETMAEDYGRSPGPHYLRGAGSCRAVLTTVFGHFHAQLAIPPRVIGVRVNGNLAYALLEWRTLPAGYIEAKREGHAWKIFRTLALQLP
jgi:hypothetical protein